LKVVEESSRSVAGSKGAEGALIPSAFKRLQVAGGRQMRGVSVKTVETGDGCKSTKPISACVALAGKARQAG